MYVEGRPGFSGHFARKVRRAGVARMRHSWLSSPAQGGDIGSCFPIVLLIVCCSPLSRTQSHPRPLITHHTHTHTPTHSHIHHRAILSLQLHEQSDETEERLENVRMVLDELRRVSKYPDLAGLV